MHKEKHHLTLYEFSLKYLSLQNALNHFIYAYKNNLFLIVVIRIVNRKSFISEIGFTINTVVNNKNI